MRQIKVLSSTQNFKVIHSEATTWGQLKEVLSEFGNLDQMNVVVKETRNSLQVPEAVLPEGDFTLYLSPKQIKAGGNYNPRAVQILNDLKTEISEAIDKVIESVEDGDYDHLPTAASSEKKEVITDEDLKALASLKGL